MVVNYVAFEKPREDPQSNTALLRQVIEQARIRPTEAIDLDRAIR